jgi:hypothetical protein
MGIYENAPPVYAKHEILIVQYDIISVFININKI